MFSVTLLKVLIVVFYLGMLIMNYLANKLPLNHRSTGDISNEYKSLFTPSGITFSIWGVIYLFLGLFVFQTILSSQAEISHTFKEPLMIVFILSSIFNVLWLVMWHYDKIFISTLVMILLFATLLVGYLMIPNSDMITKTPFSLYTAWVSVALIANITILLVKHNFSGFGIKPEIYLLIILLVAATIGITTIITMKDMIFGFVYLWAFLGILIKHIFELNKKYSFIIYTLIGLMVVLSSVLILQLISNGFQVYGV